MRTMSSVVKTILDQDEIAFFYLVEVGSGSRLIRHTTLQRDVVVGGITYVSNSGLMTVDPPKLSAVVDREAYKITYADPTFQYRPFLEEGFMGVPMIVRIGFFNTTGAPLGGANPGEPITDIAHTLIIYEGTVDNQGYIVDMEGNEATLALEGSSPMTALGLVRTIVTSKDNLRQRNASDTAYDQIYTGSKQIELLWGKRKD